MSDDRPKKSWREIDKGRDRSGGGAVKRDPAERDRAKVEKTAAYSKYKSQLDKLFTPGGAALPDSMRETLGPASPESQAQRKVIDALRATPNEETLRAALTEGAPLPDDPRLLMGLLNIKDETLIISVLRALIEMIDSGKKPNRMLLLQKVDALKNRTLDSDIIELATLLRQRME